MVGKKTRLLFLTERGTRNVKKKSWAQRSERKKLQEGPGSTTIAALAVALLRQKRARWESERHSFKKALSEM